VNLESTGDSKRHGVKLMSKRNQTLMSGKNTDIKVRILGNLYEMVCKYRLLYDAEMWDFEEG
jgi:hypothetical protein